MWIAAAGPLMAVPAGYLFVFADDWRLSVLGFFLFQGLNTVHLPPCYVAAQNLAPVRIRATAAVFVTLATGFIGTGLAPLVIGMLNDLLFPTFGPNAIRYSLAIIVNVAALAGVAALLGSRFNRQDYAAAAESLHSI